MKRRSKYLGFVVAAIIIVIILIVAGTYNSFISKQEKVKLQWNEVQNAYQRRLDLIPNLVNVVKGISGYESSVLTDIAKARSNAQALVNSSLTTQNIQEQLTTQNNVAIAANRVIATIEKYPDLKGTQSYKDLQIQLEGTERRIKVARQDFNLAIADYNQYVRSFPQNIIANIFGFHAKEGFRADEGSENVKEIKF
ncbi:MAG: LemA family protein [Bacteroidetes bacterium]|nr:LemA family protein [Bacteroidota bacterium]